MDLKNLENLTARGPGSPEALRARRVAEARAKRTRRVVPDATQQFAYSLSQGNLKTAMQALIDEQQITPLHQGEFSEVVAPTAGDRDWAAFVKRTVTDPLNAALFLMTLAFPVGKTALLRASNQLGDYRQSIGLFERYLGTPLSLLMGKDGKATKARHLIMDGADEMAREYQRGLDRIRTAGMDFLKLEGREVTKQDRLRAMLAVDEAQGRSLSTAAGRTVGAKAGLRNRLTAGQERLAKAYEEALGDTRAFVTKHKIDDRVLRKELVRDGLWLGDDGLVRHAADSRAFRSGMPYASKRLAEMRRRGVLAVPNPEDLKLVEDDLLPGTVDAARDLLAPPPNASGGLGGPVKFMYGMDVQETLERYARSTARWKTWNAPVGGLSLADKLNLERQEIGKVNPWLLKQFDEVIMPAAKGQMNVTQVKRAIFWDQWRQGQVKWIQGQPIFKQGVGKKIGDWAIRGLETWGPGLEGAAAATLYMGALGLNFSSSVSNLSQLLTTTAPMLGIRETLLGTWDTIKRMGKHAKLRAAGVDPIIAFKRTYPEYAGSALEVGEGFGHEIFETIEATYRKNAALGRVGNFLMFPFRGTEKFNRLVTFHTALRMSRPVGRSRAIRFAEDMVQETQFLSGGLGRPNVTQEFLNTPLLRMFSSFPGRLSFMVGSKAAGALRGNKEDLGFLARAGLLSNIASDAAKDLVGVDMDHALLPASLPWPSEQRAGLPWMPPIVSLGTAGVQALMGDVDPLMRVAPITVPGGLAINRAVSMLSPGWAKVARQRYADLEDPDETGRVPLYSKDGAYIGHFLPRDIAFAAFGFRAKEIQDVGNANKFFDKQRQIERELRTELRESFAMNDMRAFSAATKKWQSLYGEAPKPFDQADLRSVKMRRFSAQVDTIRQSMAPEIRGQFDAILPAAVIGRTMDDAMGMGMQEFE